MKSGVVENPIQEKLGLLSTAVARELTEPEHEDPEWHFDGHDNWRVYTVVGWQDFVILITTADMSLPICEQYGAVFVLRREDYEQWKRISSAEGPIRLRNFRNWRLSVQTDASGTKQRILIEGPSSPETDPLNFEDDPIKSITGIQSLVCSLFSGIDFSIPVEETTIV